MTTCTASHRGLNIKHIIRIKHNEIFSTFGVANDILRLMKGAKYAYSQPHNNTGEIRDNGSTHPNRENALEYRNYVNKFSVENGTYYVRFVVMRTVDGENNSHGAVMSDVHISKENAIGDKSNGVKSGAKSGAIPSDTRLASVMTLKPDAKLQNFFEYASNIENISDGSIYKIPLKGESVVINNVRFSNRFGGNRGYGLNIKHIIRIKTLMNMNSSTTDAPLLQNWPSAKRDTSNFIQSMRNKKVPRPRGQIRPI